MKNLKFGLRLWLTLTSVISFAVGWILLVHAPKPQQFSMNVSSPTLEPLPPLFDVSSDSNFQNQNQQFFSVQPRMRSNPFFRTGGS